MGAVKLSRTRLSRAAGGAGNLLMAKLTTRYVCQACGHSAPRWVGRCPECGAFSTFAEEAAPVARKGTPPPPSTTSLWSAPPRPLSAVEAEPAQRLRSGMSEFDRVLGGGTVPGSLVLIGGDPGIGKSTLLIEAAVRLADAYGSGLYVSGEESLAQVGLRAKRLGLEGDALLIACETDVAAIEAHIRAQKPALAVVDSIQTIAHPDLEGAPGTLSQVRAAASTLQRVAKETGTPIFLVGHVTKEGNLAGPRALEHIVDAVLQLEGETHTQFRILRAHKNRFGSTNELGVFEMTERGMISVENPSRLFLAQRQAKAPGTAVAAVVEGARPLLVEVQALCAPSYFAAPRRVVTGADYNRVMVVLAVVEKRVGLRLGDMDVFVNVPGGIRVDEPALDLALALAIVSSLRDLPLPAHLCAFGEVGLAGEVRAVGHGERRAREAARLGFEDCLMPQNGIEHLSGTALGIALHGASNLREVIDHWLPAAGGGARNGGAGSSRTRVKDGDEGAAAARSRPVNPRELEPVG